MEGPVVPPVDLDGDDGQVAPLRELAPDKTTDEVGVYSSTPVGPSMPNF
jgi:hypothetical protein